MAVNTLQKRLRYVGLVLLLIMLLNIIVFNRDFTTKIDTTISKAFKSEIGDSFVEQEINDNNREVIKFINNNQFDKLIEMISTRASSLNEYDMRRLLGEKIKAKGKFNEIASISNYGMSKNGEELVKSKIRLSYEKGFMNFEIIWNKDLEIVGFNLK